jgi:signal recognition particle receptor subunit beta
MQKMSREAGEVNARIVYWGPEGSGKSTNLHAAFAKLRPDHRGEIKQVPTRIDPTVGYEVLPIALGEIAGVRTQIEMVAVPGDREQGPTRKQLLDQVAGIVLVVDGRPDRSEANLASLRELRQALAAYGRSLERVPLVVQYNKRDLADPYAIEDLHRRLELGNAPVFEAVATQGTGVLQTLSTISKRVIRALREQEGPGEPASAPVERAVAPVERPLAPVERPWAPVERPLAPALPEPAAPPPPTPAERMERALLQETELSEASAEALLARGTEELLAPTWDDPTGEIERSPGARIGADLTIVSIGEALRTGDRELRLPLVLGDGSGQTSTLVLTLRLDTLIEPGPSEDPA